MEGICLRFLVGLGRHRFLTLIFEDFLYFLEGFAGIESFGFFFFGLVSGFLFHDSLPLRLLGLELAGEEFSEGEFPFVGGGFLFFAFVVYHLLISGPSTLN